MYLIDTNILIYYIDGNAKAITFIDNHDTMMISIISVIEVLSYPYDDNKKKPSFRLPDNKIYLALC